MNGRQKGKFSRRNQGIGGSEGGIEPRLRPRIESLENGVGTILSLMRNQVLVVMKIERIDYEAKKKNG